jgi:hypothetical protein
MAYSLLEPHGYKQVGKEVLMVVMLALAEIHLQGMKEYAPLIGVIVRNN